MKHLTIKQKQTLRDIIEFIEDFGYPPTIRELVIRDKGANTIVAVRDKLERLSAKGYIVRDGTPRTIVVLKDLNGDKMEVKLVAQMQADSEGM